MTVSNSALLAAAFLTTVSSMSMAQAQTQTAIRRPPHSAQHLRPFLRRRHNRRRKTTPW
jgi:hypothetical protein